VRRSPLWSFKYNGYKILRRPSWKSRTPGQPARRQAIEYGFRAGNKTVQRPEVQPYTKQQTEELLSRLERKHGYSLAESARKATSDGMQRLANFAKWDFDGMRDDVWDYVVGRLGEPDGGLEGV
jgi:hypothetical protein